MVLRLMLVSVVAGLGISPPAGNELAGWMHSVQTWVNGQIAGWDARELLDKVAEDADVAGPAADLSPEALIDELMAELADQPASDEPARTEGEDTTTSADRAFERVVEEMVADFSPDEAANPTPADREPAPQADEPTDTEEASLAERPSEVEVAMPSSETDDASLDVGDDLYPGLACTLNRQSDGLGEPATVTAPTTATDGDAPTGNQLNHAVRLTRDAVYAWIHLLQSPALVTIAR
jgi:hypothetical protein